MMRVDVLVVGAGFSGATAGRLIAETGFRVHVIDRRPHVGGNAWDTVDAWGVRIHPYGPHAFHTDADRIVAFLSRFTAWIPYGHRVLASVDGMLVPMPVNRTTVNRLYGRDRDDAGMIAFLERVREPRDPDGHQAQPSQGYTRMFDRMLDHPNMSVTTGCEFAACRAAIAYRHLVQRYRTLAAARADVTFVGRLAQYRYYNMDQAVGAAMTAAARVIATLANGRAPDGNHASLRGNAPNASA